MAWAQSCKSSEFTSPVRKDKPPLRFAQGEGFCRRSTADLRRFRSPPQMIWGNLRGNQRQSAFYLMVRIITKISVLFAIPDCNAIVARSQGPKYHQGDRLAIRSCRKAGSQSVRPLSGRAPTTMPNIVNPLVFSYNVQQAHLDGPLWGLPNMTSNSLDLPNSLPSIRSILHIRCYMPHTDTQQHLMGRPSARGRHPDSYCMVSNGTRNTQYAIRFAFFTSGAAVAPSSGFNTRLV